MKHFFLLAVLLGLFSGRGHAQQSDSAAIAAFFSASLGSGNAYGTLRHLCKNIGPRLSGSKGAADAVTYMQQQLTQAGADKVWLQEVLVPHWERGKPEKAWATSKKLHLKKQSLSIAALGGSIATPEKGITAQVLEVNGLEGLKALTPEQAKGRILFFNKPMPPGFLSTFQAYGAAVGQRGRGASEASRLGAVGALVRSMTLLHDDHPHTGSLRYLEDVPPVPAAAISTAAADELSRWLKQDPGLQVHLELNCRTLPDALSHNVIAELKGSTHPNEVIVIGGHLDAWDLAEGAHDDGAGCVQAMDVLRLYKQLGLKPKRTIRVVLFMNEENGLRGGRKYAEWAKTTKEQHIAAIESDRGGFTPRGFSFGGSAEVLAQVRKWQPLLAKFHLGEFEPGGGGADIGPLKGNCLLLAELLPDSQRYFDYHHAATDVFEAVNQRELELGGAAMAALVYLLDTYGLPDKPAGAVGR